MPQQPCLCLIDDDPDVLGALTMLIERLGFRVHATADAESVIALVAAGRVAAVLTDMRMPDINGAQLIAALRAADRALPIIALSGAQDLDGHEVERYARAQGATAFLAKPLRASQLSALLAKLLPSG